MAISAAEISGSAAGSSSTCATRSSTCRAATGTCRWGRLAEPSLKSRRVGSYGQYLVAAPRLLEERAAPRSPGDPAAFPLVANAALADPAGWVFTDAAGCQAKVRGDIAATVSTTPAVLAGALCRPGGAVLPSFLVDGFLGEGRLVRLLPDWRLKEGGIRIVYPPGRFRLPRVAAFADMLARASEPSALAAQSG
ncbi:LysR substrate-binding domain-containing protein [Mangrovicoccus sp. HB161399]|uniref:LysR substrate-binding domain-containing protein n=1 Tax=Mangrovicoccus sp. HB161399 TaxID=2720392 RepID=UPI0015577CD3|nr:LysR substrate-binding domain-containing protein [Mangrovicoccus sp. HB161399]